MTRTVATTAAFLGAAFLPALLFAILTPVSGGFDALSFFGLLVVGYLFSVVAVGLFGIPVFLLLGRLGLVRLWTILAAGCAGGMIVSFVIRAPNPPQANDFLITVAMGISAAFAFWFVWRLGRHSRANNLRERSD